MKKTAIRGGAAVTLGVAVNPRGGSWGDDGNIVLAPNLSGPLSRISSAGGALQAITKPEPGEAAHRWPQVLPGSGAVLYSASPSPIAHEDSQIKVVSLKTGESKVVQRGGYFGRYLPTGHLIYVHQGAMLGLKFDIRRLEARGAAVVLTDDVAANLVTGGGQIDFSAAPESRGTLLYMAGPGATQKWQIAWLDSSGGIKPVLPAPGVYTMPHLSPDGRKLAYGSDTGIHVFDLDRDASVRLTSDTNAINPVWTPDGRQVVYTGGVAIHWIRSDGAGEPITLFASAFAAGAWSFSPDGRSLAMFETTPETGTDLWILPLDISDPDHPKPGERQLYLRTPANEILPAFSPDGKWIAYRTDESGANEICVRPYPLRPGKWQVSVGGGLYVVWSKKSQELFYEASDHRVMVVDYRVEDGTFVAGKPRIWADQQIFYPGVSNLDIAPDGKRFAVLTLDNGSGDERPVHVTMLLNFFDEIKRRIP